MSHTGQGKAAGEVYTWDGSTWRWAFPSSCGTLLRRPTITAAELKAAIDAVTATATDANPGYLRLCGDVMLEARIDLTPANSNLILEFDKAGRIATSLAPPVGQADDPDNALVRPRGVEDPATLNTTLSQPIIPGQNTAHVNALGALTVGRYIVVGANCATMGTDLNGASAGNTDIYEVKKVTAIDVPTKTLTLDEPFLNYFGASGAQPARVLALNPIRNVTFLNGLLDCTGGSIADGFSTLYALNIQFHEQKAAGFSRGAIELGPGTQYWRVEDYLRLGETNADIFTRAAHEGTIRGYRYLPGAREHANGYPRGNITMRQRSNGDRVEDCMIGSGNVAILTWGGFNLALDGVTARDCNPAARIARANADGGTAGTVGSVLQTNCADLALSDYPFGMQIDGLKVECVATPGNPGTAVYLEDVRGGTFDDITVTNLGVAGAMNGVLVSDCKSAEFGKVSVRGCQRALVFENGGYSCTFDSVEIQQTGGSGSPPATAPIYLNLAIPCTILINRLRASDFTHLVEFGVSYPIGNIFEVNEYVGDGVAGSIDKMYAVKNGSTGNKAMGAQVMLDPATPGQVIDATPGGAPSKCLTVVKGISDDTSTMAFVMVAINKPGNRGQARCASTPAGVSPGDPLRHLLNGEAVADAAALGDSLGVAVTALAPNTAGLVATE